MGKHLQENNVKTINGNSIVGTGDIIISATGFILNLYTDIVNTAIPSGMTYIRTGGHTIMGKGAATYRLIPTPSPATPNSYQTNSLDGRWWTLAESELHADMFGAIGDGDDARGVANRIAIQAAIDYARPAQSFRNGQGTTISFEGGGNYKIIGQIVMKTGVRLNDPRAQSMGGINEAVSSGAALTRVDGSANAVLGDDKFMIITENNASGWVINGLQIIGGPIGQQNRNGGIRVYQSGTGNPTIWSVTNCAIKGWGIEALWGGGTPFVVSHNMIQGMNNPTWVNDRVLAAGEYPSGVYAMTRDSGACRLYGVDGTVVFNEFTGAANQGYGAGNFGVSTQNFNAAAAHFGALNLSHMTDNIYQVGEVGLRATGTENVYTSERFDTNAGHGMYINGGGNNVFTGCQWVRNSLAGDNLYDGIYIVDSIRNVFRDPYFSAGAAIGGQKQRYFINDRKAVLNKLVQNKYSNIRSSDLPGTDYISVDESSPHWMPQILVESAGLQRITGNSATPEVWAVRDIILYNSTATTITNFIKGLPGQILYIYGDTGGGATTTLQHTTSGSGIRLGGGKTTYVPTPDRPITLHNRGTYTNPVWVQVDDERAFAINTITNTSTNLNHTHWTLLVDAGAGARSLVLPTGTEYVGKVYNIKKIDATANAVTIVGVTDGVTDRQLTVQNTGLTIQYNGTAWYII